MRLIVLFAEVKRYKISFDVYGLMLYYAKKDDESKALLLFKATLSEYWYKTNNGITTGLTSDDEAVAILFNEMQYVIDFINIEILPSLILEPKGIMQKYGGPSNFDKLFRDEVGFTQNVFLDDDYQEEDADIYSKDQIIRYFEFLRDFLQFTLENNIRYRVFVD